MARPYPREFRDDVVRVARNRDDGVTIEQIATDFGVHPMTLQVLRAQGYDTGALRSKSWEEFAGPDAPQLDFVFTVCDTIAGETCPVWPGQPLTAHWGVADPVKVEGSEPRRLDAFSRTQNQLLNRLRLFTSLPLAKLDRLAIQHEIDRIGQTSAAAEG